MIRLSSIGYKYYIIGLAVILEFYFLGHNEDLNLSRIHPDAKSALSRVRTSSCHSEIEEIALLSIKNSTKTTKELQRSCPHDTQEIKFHQVGCIGQSKSIIKLEYPAEVRNITLCCNLCFAYGHKFGGLNNSEGRCYCSDNYESTIQHTDCIGPNRIPWYRVDIGVHDTISMNYRVSPNIDVDRPITIAFLLSLNGRSILQINRLLRLLYNKKHIYYIHIDKRRDYLHRKLLPLQEKFDNILVTDKRYPTIWGGPSLLTMILKSMLDLKDKQWDYLINLSESDFPLKSLNELEEFLHANDGGIFLKLHNIKGYNFIRKQGLDKIFYQCEERVWRIGDRVLPQGIRYSGGSDWFALPRDFCNYIISSSTDKEEILVPTLLNIFNQTLLPAESFFHTVALNGKFCDRFRDNNLRFTNWQRKQGCKCQHKNVVDWCGCSPMVFRPDDWVRLEKTRYSSSLFFARKFDPTISSRIINKVESELIEKFKLDWQLNDTRYWLNVYDENDKDEASLRHKLAYQEFARLAMKSAPQDLKEARLRSVDLYFDQDQFIGHILDCCDIHDQCLQMLVEKNIASRTLEVDYGCLRAGERRLQVLDVGHGFDTSERLFRDLSPLDQSSDVIVYHEWLVQSIKNNTNTIERLQFSWINPDNVVRSVQDAKLKMSRKLTRLYLAHRLNITKPMDPGRWTLVISRNSERCFARKFLILSSNGTTRQHDFDQFYTVTRTCGAESSRIEEGLGCSDWALKSKEQMIENYALTLGR